MTLRIFASVQGYYLPSYMVLGSLVFELHDMRIFCLLRAVTPWQVINTFPFALAIASFHYYDSSEVLQAKVVRGFVIGPPCPVPRALNKQYSARVDSTAIAFMYFTRGYQVSILAKFHVHRFIWWGVTQHSGFIYIGSVLSLRASQDSENERNRLTISWAIKSIYYMINSVFRQRIRRGVDLGHFRC